MNVKSLTIGGAFTALIAGIIYQYGELITPDFLLLAALILFFVFLSYGVSWGATQAYKVLCHSPGSWTKNSVKAKIYLCAIISAAGTMLACGTFLLLAEGLTGREKIVISVFWGLGCVFVGLTSPFLWRFVFDNVMPRLRRWAKGRNGENEALDRPSEVPRE